MNTPIKKLYALSLLTLLSAVAPVSWAACLGDKAAAKEMSVSIVPQLPRAVTYAKWAPILEYVGPKIWPMF